jgi:hypothetical protein
MRRAALAAALLVPTAACVYYNGMWSARRFAREAVKHEARGEDAEAKVAWARAAIKAESLLAHHPRSRWADDALVLEGEGRAGSGACTEAAAPLDRALGALTQPPLLERAALARAGCALTAGDPARAARLLQPVLSSDDRSRRSRAGYLAGLALLASGYADSAIRLLSRSTEPAARAAEAQALIAAGRATEVVDLAGRRSGRVDEAAWLPVFDELGRATNPATASAAVDRFVAVQKLTAGARARLLLADGDRLLAAGERDQAGARFTAAARLVPDSAEGRRAEVRALRATVAGATGPEDLPAARDALARFTSAGAGGEAAQEAAALQALLQRIATADDAPEGERFRAAELARDSLGAPRLAAALFVRFAHASPGSLFAPKAIVAAIALAPALADSLLPRLDSAYASSPYTLALHGDLSPGYGAAEDSLAQLLGVARGEPETDGGEGVAPPVPGPRGPALDPGPPTAPRGAGAGGGRTRRPAEPKPARAVDRNDHPLDRP